MTRPGTDVVVVGASVAGLVAALDLARAGHTVTVVDPIGDPSAPPRLTWTAVHHWSVLPVLDRLGVLDHALFAGEATAHWGLRVLATGEQFVFDLRELGQDVRHPFNLRLEPHLLREILRSALLDCRGASLHSGAAVTGLRQDDDEVVVRLADGTDLAARWVVGADGPASAVRRHAGLGFEGTTWTERGVVALVDHDFGARGYADTTFQVDGRAGAVVERVGPTTWRYVFQESLALDESSLDARLVALLREVTGAEPEVLGWAAARMHQRSATSYRAGRVVLVGSAAHVTHPMAGHTSLSGWHDAATVASVLVPALRSGGDVGVSEWAVRRRRIFLDDAAPISLGRRNLVAQITEPRRLEVELDVFRRASTDAAFRREMLRSELDAVAGNAAARPPF